MAKILKEGGNVFKKEDQPLTQRIATKDVHPTIQFIEKITGLTFDEQDWLGTTGKKNNPDGAFEDNSSGDLDLNTDANKVSKEELIAKLSAWLVSKGIPEDQIMNQGRKFTAGWIHNAGDQVHFRAPIQGSKGYVQTDFMFTTNPDFQRGAKRGGTGQYTGADRAVLLSSIARGRGYKMSPKFGLVDPNKGDEVVADNWDDIASMLLGKGATEKDTHTVDSILAKLKGDSNYEELIAPWKEHMTKAGKTVESRRNGIRAGMLEAQRTDELLGKVAKGIGRGIQNTARGLRAGYKLGRQGSDIGKGIDAYKDAGGRKTTVGQVANIGKTAGNTLIGNQVIVKDPGTGRTVKVAANNLKKYTDRGWQEVDPQRKGTIGVVSKDGKMSAQINPKDLKTYMKAGWVEESVKRTTTTLNEGGREINHAEDLIFWEGSKGAKRALQSIIDLEKGGHENVTVKWDGSPAVIFGRDENGEFIFTDKAGYGAVKTDGKAKSPDQLKDILLNRSGGKMKDDPGRIMFADKMANVFKLYQKAVPKDYRGFFKGDLLYYNTPSVEDGHYVFQPQLVKYSVTTNSDLGKNIGASTTGIVIHREVDADGNEGPVQNADKLQGSDVLVFPSVTVQQPPKIDNAGVKKLATLINSRSAEIDKLLDPNTLEQKQMKGFGDMLYNYINTKVDTGLDNLGKDFIKWLDTKNISMKMKQKVIEHIKEHSAGFVSLWSVVSGIQKVKDDVIRQMDSAEGDVKATTAGKPGGEGYVLSHPEGSIKFVNRSEFTAANRAIER